jgi:glycosyltransferase involved in cell wall biosynthesis
MPVVSAIVPVFRHGRLLPRAIASALVQDIESIEVIVVDDGPDCDVVHFAAGCGDRRVRLVRHDRNRGAAAARNSGVAAASGEYVAFLDADDEWLPGKLRLQLDHMKDRGLLINTSGFEMIRRDGRREINLPNPVRSIEDMLWGCNLSPGATLMAHRTLFDTVGPFDPSFPRFEDWDWLMRVIVITPIEVVPAPLARVYAGDFPSRSAIERSCQRMFEQHGEQVRAIGRSAHRKFVASLLLEEAASALNAGDTWAALGYGVKSLATWPIRNRSFYRRVLQRSSLVAREMIERRLPHDRISSEFASPTTTNDAATVAALPVESLEKVRTREADAAAETPAPAPSRLTCS